MFSARRAQFTISRHGSGYGSDGSGTLQKTRNCKFPPFYIKSVRFRDGSDGSAILRRYRWCDFTHVCDRCSVFPVLLCVQFACLWSMLHATVHCVCVCVCVCACVHADTEDL